MNRQTILSIFCILFGYSIFGTYALSLRIPFDFPIEVYWLSFVLVSIPLFCEVLLWKGNSKIRIFYLLSFSLMITLQYAVVDFSPLMSSSDAVGEYRLTDKIITESHWTPFNPVVWLFGSEYRFHPVTNFIYAAFSISTGIPLVYIVKYLFVVRAIVVPPIADRTFRSFFSGRIAYLATILFLASPGAILFPHKESFAIIFFFVSLYVMTRFQKNWKYLIIGLITTPTLIMTHHFTTYIFLGILTLLYITNYVSKGKKTIRVSTQYFVFSWIAFASWVMYVAFTIFSRHQQILLRVFSGVLLSSELSTGVLSLSAPYETIIIYIGYGVTLISAGLGFLNYIRNKKGRSSAFLAITLFLLLILAIGSIFRFSGSQATVLISHRTYEFGYIIIGAFSALFFVQIILKNHTHQKLALNLVLISSFVVMMIVGPMAGSMHPRTFAETGQVISYNSLSVNKWMVEVGASDEYTVTDRTGQLILTGYGDSMTIRSPELFTSQNFSLPENASYIATYTYMTDFYGTNLKEFNNSPNLYNVYSNGIINIYKIHDRTSELQNSETAP